MIEAIEKLEDSRRTTNGIAKDLQSLGYSLRDVGNKILAERIENMARVLTETSQDINDASSKIVGAYHAATEEGTTNMVRACLAMADRH